ncbi:MULTISPECIES: isochorismatase family cysteine hydrolase [unclassified Streptomyces]|uniref:isochorismatase family cysteine hydrolase n=1 Tax=unclassified Streptomyces TaxID=2593676 RepID=UPI001BE5DB5B|nr:MULTISPECIES: isochorismatase family cysteine hydrolase [unclassified Streptomyces]MBT2405239.1 cysteine hydrolase [Streptomyces sp. ISL-21]MBT2453352.1 cysteine hydrolase [Streptomyces sp. ISL-86]MBT2611007.1 cysteine hydrolase [Streptomyces sp. ISL-87]
MAVSALVVIDMINTYDHADAELLLPAVREALPGVRAVLDQARHRGAPVIYVNDNFGLWRSHHGEILETALAGPHADLVKPVAPDSDSLFVVKARHSIFYETPLAYLLGALDVDRLVLCGQVTEQCVLYSALDAHIRHLHVTVVRDAVAHIHKDLADAALRMMEINMAADIRFAADVSFAGGSGGGSGG